MGDFAAAPSAPEHVRHQVRFTGTAGEYFKIWIVNLALTIVTLGIFGAWAKVRNKRYFYGNTIIADHAFDYHGSPKRILVGRLIAMAALLCYGLTVHFFPAAAFAWAIVFLFGTPWLLNAALRFNARNTSYRNIRFNFTGTYGEAFKAYVLWGLLAGLTLFTTYPLARRARDRYNINHHTFGGRNFHAEIPGKDMYAIYGLAVLIFVVFVIAAGTFIVMSGSFPLDAQDKAKFQPAWLLVGAIYTLLLLFLVTFIGTKVFNLVMRGTVLAEKYQMESSLSALRMTWIMLSNLALTLCTLGLFIPVAKIRMARYRAENFAIVGPAALDGFTAELMASQGAIGEEVASFFDIDIGL